jgi:hypothetical protein
MTDGRSWRKEMTLQEAIAKHLAFINDEERSDFEQRWKELARVTQWEAIDDEHKQEYVLFILEQEMQTCHEVNGRVSGVLREKQIIHNKMIAHTLMLAIQKLRATMKVRKEGAQ